MELLNPTLLTGMVAGALPIIIHLIQRKRAPQHIFPPAELLKDAHQRVSRRIRLRHLLVMLLRVLFILLLAAAFARPFIQQVRALSLSEKPTACVVVIDDSLSMRYEPEDKNTRVFSQALERATNALGKLRDFDQSAIVTFSGREVGPVVLGSNHRKRIEKLEELKCGYGRYDAGEAIRRAREILGEADIDEKKIVILSDFTQSSWSETDFDLLTAAEADVSMPELVGPISVADNRHFGEVDVQSAGDGIDVRAEVKSVGAFEQVDFEVKLFVEEMLRDREKVDGGQSTSEARIEAEIEGREYSGRLELPEDGLLADNGFYFTGRVNSNLEILLVDGDPHETVYHNETYHMDLALSGGEDRLRTSVVTPAGLTQASLAEYDCVVFANVRPADLPEEKRLRRYLGQGGGLWFVLGDQMEWGDDSENTSGDLMPVTVRNVQKAAEGEKARIQINNQEHPVFQPFPPRWLREFSKAGFDQWWLMEPRSDAQVIMELNNGHPLLAGWKVDGGGVFVMGSSLGREWNDFCLQPVFVPFMQRAVRFMADSLATARNRQLWVNEPYQLEMADRGTSVYLHPPGVDDAERIKILEETDGSIIRYKKTGKPGLYTVARDEKGEDVISRFVVNTRPEASDTGRWRDKEVQTRRLVSQKGETGTVEKASSDDGLWHFLLWACALTLVTESVLARW